MSGKVRRKTLGRTWFAVVIGGVLLYVGCSSASVAFKEGRKAEERKDYDLAVVDFQKALRTQPNDTHIEVFENRARNEATLAHLNRGRKLLQEQRINDAASEFQKAISLDPSNQAAAQELRKIVIQRAADAARRHDVIRSAMEQQDQGATAGIQLKPLSRNVIPVLHISGNSKEVFSALGKIAGVNVVFYHDFQSRAISLDLSSVTIEDALKAAAAEAGVFWKPITPNTILIIPDTPMNRQNLESDVLSTVYLQNPLDAQDRMAILTAVKQVIGLQLKAFDNPDANAIVLYGTPEMVSEAEHLIHGLDRGQAEVLIDVNVLEAQKNYMRDLGLEPVPVTGNALGVLGFNPSTTTTTTNSSGTSTTTPYLPLNKLGSITTGDFAAVLSGVEANALLTDSRTHILDNPQVRVTAGQKATLKIGEEVPYATGSFGVPTAVTSTTSSAASLLANTQFNYKDVGVTLQIQPYVAANGDIVIHSKVEVSSVGTPENIGGVEEPEFNDRSDEQFIRLSEGQTSLLGGLIQTQTVKSVTGLPGLSEVPILKYFFSDQNYSVMDDELVITMTPHVVRLPESSPSSASMELPANAPIAPAFQPAMGLHGRGNPQ
jgi:general secretion pathway protein D